MTLISSANQHLAPTYFNYVCCASGDPSVTGRIIAGLSKFIQMSATAPDVKSRLEDADRQIRTDGNRSCKLQRENAYLIYPQCGC